MSKTVNEILLVALGCLVVVAGTYLYFSHNNDAFSAFYSKSSSTKEIDDYFIEKLGMSAEEAKNFADNEFSFYITGEISLDTVIGNLQSYGLIKDQNSFKKILEQATDNLSGKENALKIGRNTIDINAYYQLRKDLTPKEIADILLNDPIYLQGNHYNYIFMPSELPTENQETPDN